MEKYYLIFACVVLLSFGCGTAREKKAADTIDIAKDIAYMEKMLENAKAKKSDGLENRKASSDCLILLKTIRWYKSQKVSSKDSKMLSAIENKVTAFMKQRWGKYPPYEVESKLKFVVLGKKPEDFSFADGFSTGTGKHYNFIPGGRVIRFEATDVNETNVKEYIAEINRIGVSRLCLPEEISQRTFSILMKGINVEYLTFACQNITDITVLQHSTKLKELSFTSFKKINGFPALNKLKKLEKIVLAYNVDKLKDLSFMGELPNLKILYSYSSDLENLTALAGFTNLEELYMRNSASITNIKGIEKLRKLRKLELTLADCDISVLGKLTNLEELSLDCNTQDINFLTKLKKLKKLTLSVDENCDLSPIGKLTNLRVIHLPYWVKNLKFIENLTNLEKLSLNSNDTRDISILSKLSKLKKLDLSYCKNIKDYSPVGNLSELQVLFLSAANVENIVFLKNLKNLKVLHLIHNNKVKDFNPLLKLSNLKELIVADCKWFDKASKDELKKSLPKCNISFTPLCICDEGKREASF